MEINDQELIKIYLRIKTPKISEKPYYDINLEKNIFTLHDIEKKPTSSNEFSINLDKIYTDEHSNSIIYKETCSEVIKESLNGTSFCFISYGETLSDKLVTLIGDISNDSKGEQSKGIFHMVLSDLFNFINKNENTKADLSLKFSFLSINDSKLIDLNNFIDKDFSKYNDEDFLNEAKSIKNDKNLINYVKKISINNYKNKVSFINKIISLFMKLEKEKNNNFYSSSHFVIIIFINNSKGEKISVLTFILLNGSENLNKAENNIHIKPKEILNSPKKKKSVMFSKEAIRAHSTYNSIIYLIKQNKAMNSNNFKKSLNQDNINSLIEKESKFICNLTALLYYVCFDWNIKNIKYIIFGNVFTNVGYYQNVKDSIFFLYELYKISHKKVKNKSLKEKKENKEENKDKNNSNSSSSNEEGDNSLNNSMFELEHKVREQNRIITALNNLIDKKNQKIFFLEREYNNQVEQLKKSLGFVGDVNILLSGNEYTMEVKSARRIRESSMRINILNDKIKELELKLEKSNDEIKKLKIREETLNNDKVMIRYLQSVNEIKENKKAEAEKKSLIFNKIADLEKELKNKTFIISKLEQELNNKNEVIQNFSKIINKKNNIKKDEKEEKESSENEKNNFNEFGRNKNNLKYYYNDDSQDEDIIKEKNKIIEKLKKKNENLKEKNQSLEETTKNNTYEIKRLNDVINFDSSEIKTYKREFLKLDEILMELFHKYKANFIINSKDFNIISIRSKLEEFNNFVIEAEKSINYYTFPKLHKLLESNNKLSINYKTVVNKTKIKGKIDNPKLHLSKSQFKFFENVGEKPFTSKQIDVNNNDNIQKSNKIINNFSTNSDKTNNSNSNSNSNSDIILSQSELEKMEKNKIVEHCLLLNEKINDMETFIQKYNKINFENEENKKQIFYLNSNLSKVKKDLEEQIKINYNNKIIIMSQNRTIEKYKNNMDIKNLMICIDDKKNNDFSLTLSPKQKKKGLYINKSEVNLRIKNDFIYNKDIANNKRNKIFSADKKDNIHNFIESKKLKEIQVNSNNFGINSDEIIKDKKLQNKFSSQKASNLKSNIYKNDFSYSYNNFHSYN